MWSNHPELTRNCPVGLLPPASQWFEEVWCGRTTPNSLETAFFLKQQSGSRRVGVVEPPRTHWNLPCRPASPCFTEVWCGPELIRNCPVGLHHSEVRCGSTRNCPVGLLPPASQWFEEVWCGRTTPNSLETAFFLKQQSGLRRVGVVEPPRTHSKVPCRPASPCSTVVRGGLVWSNHPELTGLQGSFE